MQEGHSYCPDNSLIVLKKDIKGHGNSVLLKYFPLARQAATLERKLLLAGCDFLRTPHSRCAQ